MSILQHKPYSDEGQRGIKMSEQMSICPHGLWMAPFAKQNGFFIPYNGLLSVNYTETIWNEKQYQIL